VRLVSTHFGTNGPIECYAKDLNIEHTIAMETC